MRDPGEDPKPAHGRVRQVHVIEPGSTLDYSPDLDGLADPGEIVWAWVPYEEDPDRGKDRPLLVIGRNGQRLLAMMLSSKDRTGQRGWVGLGNGSWDRMYELDEDDIRREGAVLEPERFARVAAAVAARTRG
ncbi:type II toxin-antitoxin system PemK/MazF family toxin [Kibdelosporangium persicum]|uniref:Growth inhibitor PemK n=1 Tax=Kibdelosporangium persicum TaxID=2698649 RepID=A0ABX2F5X2_9PSEU|nr:type II toxin-antitoxin system PemK/MazF family toxin [Kibdelosporangium persicum]NRN66761.1 Growth inhibitor PemK [Kibdelosporangium persicum]